MQVCLTKKINKIQEKFKTSLTQHTHRSSRGLWLVPSPYLSKRLLSPKAGRATLPRF